jgi:hypothetical protein
LIRHPVADLVTDVPVWPGVSVVNTPWRTPATPGHYCIEIELWHPNDGNPANNLGWNNTQVKAAASRVETPVRIFNRWVAGPPAAQWGDVVEGEATHGRVPWNLVEVTVDSYVFHDAYGREADPAQMFAARPPAWSALVDPALFHFAPDETYRDVMLIVDAPSGPGDHEVFNVSAWQGGGPLGGVTVSVTRG